MTRSNRLRTAWDIWIADEECPGEEARSRMERLIDEADQFIATHREVGRKYAFAYKRAFLARKRIRSAGAFGLPEWADEVERFLEQVVNPPEYPEVRPVEEMQTWKAK